MKRLLAALFLLFALTARPDAFTVYQWGTAGDLPVPGDYDGDGKTDLAIFRPSTGQWFVLTSQSNFTTFAVLTWGMAGDVPVAGNYDGFGQTQVAVFRPSTGQWFLFGAMVPRRFECKPEIPGCLNYDRP